MANFPVQKISRFQHVFEKGKRHKTKTSHVIVFVDKQDTTKSGVFVGILALKKVVSRSSVKRHKAKRRFYHALLHCLQNEASFDDMEGTGIWMVALTNAQTVQVPWEELLLDVRRHLDFIRRLL